MSMPKFKPTKWKMHRCLNCKRASENQYFYCKDNGHNIEMIDNIPFFVPDMEFEWIGQKWSTLRSKKLGQEFSLSASKLEKIIMGCGVGAGGKINNKWWMYAKVGGSLTIIWVPGDE